MKHFSVARMTRIGALGAIAAILYAIPGIPIIPPIYKLDFSTVPALLAALIGGPVDSVIVILIKDLTGLLHSSSSGVGEIADFLCSAALCLPVCFLIGRTGRSPADLAVISAVSTALMAAAGCLVNYYIMIPFYVKVQGFPLDTIVNMVSGVIPAVKDLPTLICFATAPFNLLKGAAVCLIAFPIWKRLPQKKIY